MGLRLSLSSPYNCYSFLHILHDFSSFTNSMGHWIQVQFPPQPPPRTLQLKSYLARVTGIGEKSHRAADRTAVPADSSQATLSTLSTCSIHFLMNSRKS